MQNVARSTFSERFLLNYKQSSGTNLTLTTAARSGTNWEVHLRQNYKSYKTERLGSLRGLVMMLMLTLY